MATNQLAIGTRVYSFGNIPPTEAIKVEVVIARACGEPLFKAFMDSKKTGMTKEEMEAAGGMAIGLIASRVNSDELLATMETVFTYVSVDGKRCIIDQDFVGRNKELWQVFIAALKFNFSDFLPEGLLTSVQKFTQK